MIDPIVVIILAVVLLLIIAAVVVFLVIRKKKKNVTKAIPVNAPSILDAAPVPSTQNQYEQYYEAYPYEGGPVIGIEIAEEVSPTVAAIMAKKDPDTAAQNTVASLLGNGFDPFLITLNEKEKNEFVDIYVLKCKGIMPEIPGYIVGGDNKDFFNKVFIYLGQYREKIPAGLLSKMYEFSMKI